MDDELYLELRSRELRSQHIPKTPNRAYKLDELLWTNHDENHEWAPYGSCETCARLNEIFLADGNLPLTEEGIMWASERL